MSNEIPRRNRLELNTLAEMSINHSIHEVEKLPADERLTKVVTLLSEAKELLSDWVDENQKPNYEP